MENSSEKSKFEKYRDSQKVASFDKYPPVEKYMGPTRDLKHTIISKSSRPPHSEVSGNDR